MCKCSCVLFIAVAFALLWTGTHTARVLPSTPCPETFNYIERLHNEIFGAIKIENDRSGVYDLEVNMSIGIKTDQNIKIVRKTAEYRVYEGHSIEYYVIFPSNHTLPILTSIKFNGKLYCLNPPDHGSDTTSLSGIYVFKTLTKEQIERNIFSKYPIGECGITLRPLSLQGRPNEEEEYPWLVALFHLKNGTYNFRCPGTLVSNKHVITAAHCVTTFKNTVIDLENLVVVFGRHDINNWAVKSKLRGVKKIVRHPDFDRPSDADVAVIVTDSPVDFSQKIKPICLWDEPMPLDTLGALVDKRGVIVAWKEGERTKPRQFHMPVVEYVTCLRSDFMFRRITSTRTFCAGDRNGNIPCVGESGAGFMIRRNGKWTLRGVLSAVLSDPNTNSCDGGNYAVFSDVPKYNEWLNAVLKED